MKIFYFVRQINMVPSCLYNILMLKKLGYEVIAVFGASTESIQKSLDAQMVKSYYGELYSGKRLGLKGVLYYFEYRKYAFRVFKQLYDEGDIAFLGTADTAISLFDLHKLCPTAVCIKELYENGGIDVSIIKSVTRRADAVIACEKNRARLMKYGWKLKELPFVISNKPFTERPFEEDYPLTTESTREIAAAIRGKKVVLYQGFHVGYPNELANIARALNEIGGDFIFLLMGLITDKAKTMLEGLYSNVVTTGLVPAPTHMEITQFARIGITLYSEDQLNNLFCAPNKIYEYAAFGIPSLCNDLPGLIETVGISRAGLCVDINDVSSIVNAIREIDANYDDYSKNARAFYNSEDNLAVISDVVNRLQN